MTLRQGAIAVAMLLTLSVPAMAQRDSTFLPPPDIHAPSGGTTTTRLTGPGVVDVLLDVTQDGDAAVIRYRLTGIGEVQLAVSDEASRIVANVYVGPVPDGERVTRYEFPESGRYLISLTHDARPVASLLVSVRK